MALPEKSGTRPRVWVLQHSAHEPPGAIEDALHQAGYELRYARLFAGEPAPPEMGDAAGLVVMGGPMGVYEQDRYPFLRDERSLIESCLSAGQPILGICLGSQLLASALGAPVVKGPQKEIGWHPVRLAGTAQTDPLFADIPAEFTALHWHGDVYDLPAGAVSLASSSLTACQAFRYGENAWGLLFHLEATAEIVKGMVTAFTEELRNAGIQPDEVLTGVTIWQPSLQAIGNRVFSRWAGRLANRQ